MIKIASWAVLIGGFVAAFTGGRVWVRFTVEDPVLGPGARTASGYAVSSALSAACIVALAAGLAALLTRRTPRSIALLVLALDAAWGAWLSIRVVSDPNQALVTSGSPDLGLTTTGELSAQGVETTLYAYVFLVAAVAVAAGAIMVVVGTRRRFSRPKASLVTSDTAAAQRGTAAARPLPAAERERRANAAAWEELSRGEDPTATTEAGPAQPPTLGLELPESRTDG